MRVEKTVFISYRRTNVYTAIAVYQYLKSQGYDVFYDSESIDSGAFGQIILNQIAARAHFIVILTPSALERCNEPDDWLRKEIEQALDTKRNIIPLMFDRFDFRDVKTYLTGKLARLQAYNALEVPVTFFEEAMERLRTRFLNVALDVVIHPTPPENIAEVERKIEIADTLPVPTEAELTAEQYFERAYQRDEQKDYAGAIADYTEALRLNSQYSAAYNNRGTARAESRDYAGAITDFAAVLRLNPEDAEAYYNRGTARRRMGDYAGAMADYSEALRLNPGYAKVYYNRGIARAESGDYAGAIADYDAALRLNPEHAYAYNSRGGVRYHLGDYAGAIADYDEVLRLNPEYAYAYNNRGEAHFTKSDYSKASDDFKKAIELQSDLSIATAGLAITYHALNDIPQSLNLWRQLIAPDERCKDADWVGKEFRWRPELIEEARKLIAKL